MLETFRMKAFLNEVTLASMCAIALVLINGCPRLEEIDFTDTGKYESGKRHYPYAITGMLEGAGREEDINVIYDREYDINYVDSDEDE